MNLKSLFKRKKKEEEVRKWTVSTHVRNPLNTESITISEKDSSLIVQLSEGAFNPFEFKVKKEYLHSLHNNLVTLNEIAKQRGHEFNITPFINGFDKIKRRHVYLDLKREDNRVFDIDLYFDKKGQIDSFSVGTRTRFFAYYNEPPKVIEKTPLSEFHKAMDYLMTQI